MQPIKNILVPSDFSANADAALENAVMLARKYSAQLTLLHIVTVHDDDPYNSEFNFPQVEKYNTQREEIAAESLANLEVGDLQISKVVKRDFSPANGILQYIEENDVDLVAMGTHGHNPFTHFILGSVTEKVVHHAGCPVLVTHKTPTLPRVVTAFKSLLVPVDFSIHSEKALTFAASLLEKDGKIDIIHVLENEIHPAYYASDEVSLFDFMPHLKTHTTESLKKMAQKILPTNVQVNFHIVEGNIYRRIIEYAEEKAANAIVMGTHGMNNFEQIFLGSITNRIIRKAQCPVVTVK